MQNLEFLVGRLDQAINDFRRDSQQFKEDMKAEVSNFRADIKALRFDIDEIKLFRAKVLGAAAVLSISISVAFSVLMELGRAWAK